MLHLKPRAVIVPHAGYVYSGFTANIALRLLSNSDVKRVVIIGPSHRVYLTGTSISEFDTYHTPLGALLIDKPLVLDLKERFDILHLHWPVETLVRHPNVWIARVSPLLSAGRSRSARVR